MIFSATLHRGRFFRVASLIGLFAIAGAAQAAHFLYTGGHELDDSNLATYGGNTYTELPDSSDGTWMAALAGEYGSFDAIVVGEDQGEYTLSEETNLAIADYVNMGGKVIVLNDHSGNLTFINNAFGFGVLTNEGCYESGEPLGTLQNSAANATAFAGGPSVLHGSSCTAAYNTASLPAGAKVFYSAPEIGTNVYAKSFGAGTIVHLGFDYCCGEPADDADWYRVLDSSLRYVDVPAAIVSITQFINDEVGSAYWRSKLESPLNIALYFLTQPQGPASVPMACLYLNSYISAVRSAVSKEAISSSDGAELIAQAQSLRAALGCR